MPITAQHVDDVNRERTDPAEAVGHGNHHQSGGLRNGASALMSMCLDPSDGGKIHSSTGVGRRNPVSAARQPGRAMPEQLASCWELVDEQIQRHENLRDTYDASSKRWMRKDAC